MKEIGIIVGLHAAPRAGKDTFAGLFFDKNWNTCTLAYADGIYEDLCSGYGVLRPDFGSTESKTQPQDRFALIHCGIPAFRQWASARGIDLLTPRTSRWVMQTYGTDYMHGIDPLHWVTQTVSRATEILESGAIDNILVTDVRHAATEIAPLRQLASTTGREFVMVEIVKEWGPDFSSDHSSDLRLPAHMVDVTIKNEHGNPEAMLAQFNNFLGTKKWKIK